MFAIKSLQINTKTYSTIANYWLDWKKIEHKGKTGGIIIEW